VLKYGRVHVPWNVEEKVSLFQPPKSVITVQVKDRWDILSYREFLSNNCCVDRSIDEVGTCLPNDCSEVID